MRKIIHVLSLLTFFSCSNEKKPTQSTAADPIQATVDTGHASTPEVVPNKPDATSIPPANAGKWTYESTTDKDGNPVYKASNTALDSLKFGFPYAAGSTATLTIRKRASSTTVYLQVSNGQFNRSFQGGQARIRFDNQPASQYAFSAAENGSANVIFFDEAGKLIDRLKASKKMVIDVEFYAQGSRQIAFRTANLTWNH